MSVIVYEFTTLMDELMETNLGLARWRLFDGLLGWLRTRIQVDLGWMSFSSVRSSHVFFLSIGYSVKEVPDERTLQPIENILEDWYGFYVHPVVRNYRWCTVRFMVRGENVALQFNEAENSVIGRGSKDHYIFTDYDL